MINKTQIEGSLMQLQRLYLRDGAGRKGLYFSKLAIIEACGWIEESMDDIVRQCARKHLKEADNLDSVERFIEDTHSFKYRNNFRNMLIQLVGIINVERLERSFDAHKRARMESSLGALKKRRDEQAHTHIKGTTKTIDAPSVTITHFRYVYEGLKDIETCIRRTRI